MSYVNGNGVNLALDQIENLYRNTAYGSLDERLRAAFRTLPTGDLKNAISRNIRGINHRQIAQALMPNLDHYGLTFFTRPDLNLATPNIRQSRMLTDLLTENQKSIPRAVRCLLDPSLQLRPRGAIECPLVDANLPFIPILTNSLISCSGWPDLDIPLWSSTEGYQREQYSQVQGGMLFNGTTDISCTFNNIDGDLIGYMFFVWLFYMAEIFLVNDGLSPKLANVISATKDYETRIYRLRMDRNNKFVTRIMAANACIPYTLSTGQDADFDSKAGIHHIAQSNFSFKAQGIIYNDPILIYEFNEIVETFNTGMRDENREKYMVQIPYQILDMVNTYGYPRVHPETMELQWFLSVEDLVNVYPELGQRLVDEIQMGDPYGRLDIINKTFGKTGVNIQPQGYASFKNERVQTQSQFLKEEEFINEQ